jgi:hypothetical protein
MLSCFHAFMLSCFHAFMLLEKSQGRGVHSVVVPMAPAGSIYDWKCDDKHPLVWTTVCDGVTFFNKKYSLTPIFMRCKSLPCKLRGRHIWGV